MPTTLVRRRRPPAPSPRPRRAYPVKWVAVALAATAALLIGGPYLVMDVFLGSAPGKLKLPPADGVASGPLAAGPISGTWEVGDGSVAGYRVTELLFGQSHAAVGRTAKVTGGMAVSGDEVTAADFTVDMASVKSDQGARDVQFRGFIMRTDKYPDATFRLTTPIRLPSLPAAGHPVSIPASGDLTLRGTTRPVSFTLSAERLGSAIDVNAEIPITFGLWHVPNPSFAVARLGKTGTVEVLLRLVRRGAPSASTATSTPSVPPTG